MAHCAGQCLGWYGGAKWSILERPHVVHGRFEWATQTHQAKSKAQLHGGLLVWLPKLILKITGQLHPKKKRSFGYFNLSKSNVVHFDSVSQFHIHYMLQLNNSDVDAFHRSLIAFYCCLQEEMERLQEELEGSQQECCENVSGCYDDVFFCQNAVL